MARSWIIDIGGFAKRVKNTTLSPADQIKDSESYHECPKCHYHIHNSDVSLEWPDFPAGVKFDPSDVQLLEHLAAKCCVGNKELNMFIDEFIPTLEGDQGICYTHPENLPGAKKDGGIVHFFHRTVHAYSTGQRKRRKIHHQQGLNEEHVRWHKTGKTKAITEDGVHKGFKKIMVLYIRTMKGTKPYKSNWVMHQYHLGSDEDEKDGEYVVSKVFYQQQKQIEKIEEKSVVLDSDMALRTSPRTPKPNPPNRPCAGKCVESDDYFYENDLMLNIQDGKPIPAEHHASPSNVQDDDNVGNLICLAGESQAVDDNSDFDGLGLNDILLCKDLYDTSAQVNDSGLKSNTSNGFACNASEFSGNDDASYGISVLDTLQLDTPPDFDLSNLQFCSQDSLLQWMDKL